jgi:CBS-domain-containing membrane protein
MKMLLNASKGVQMKPLPKIIVSKDIPHPVRFPCWIELSKSGTKIHIAFDGDDLDGALDRIDEALGVRSYAVNAFMNHIEKVTKEKK